MIGDRAAGSGRWRGANRGRRLLTLVVLGGSGLVGCGSDPAATPTPSEADSGAPGADGSATDGALGPRPPCPNSPISDGELQNRASGPSVFGIVAGGDMGWFDALGGTECGVAGVRICLVTYGFGFPLAAAELAGDERLAGSPGELAEILSSPP